MNPNSDMCYECFFCDDGRFALNQSIGLPGNESVIYKDKHVFITPDISPVVLGHFLIVAEEHESSFAGVSDDVFASLTKAKLFLKEKVFRDQTVLFFEHGSILQRSAGSCIDHAHMHVLPINMTTNMIDNFICNSIFINSKKEPATHEALQQCVVNLQPYLYYEIKDDMWLYSVNKLPSQFFRQMICSVAGGSYNWKFQFRSIESKHLFLDTLRLLQNCIT